MNNEFTKIVMTLFSGHLLTVRLTAVNWLVSTWPEVLTFLVNVGFCYVIIAPAFNSILGTSVTRWQIKARCMFLYLNKFRQLSNDNVRYIINGTFKLDIAQLRLKVYWCFTKCTVSSGTSPKSPMSQTLLMRWRELDADMEK